MKSIINKIAMILFIVFAIILTIQIILKLLGHSPTDIQILYIALGAIMSYLLIMSFKWELLLVK